jgi:autonomous glycyl radical cofactor GrcA
MSQFNFTAEEDALVVTSLKYLAEVQIAAHGGAADDVVALLAKIAEQQTPNVPVEMAPEVSPEPAEEEKPAKGKKAKAEDAEPTAEVAPAAE